jgi:photosystem II stability/assembly factor-like uncharacterized protein
MLYKNLKLFLWLGAGLGIILIGAQLANKAPNPSPQFVAAQVLSPTITSSPTASPSASKSSTPTASPSASKTLSPSPDRTSTPPATRTYTREAKPSRTRQSTSTRTITGTRPATSTPSLTPTVTAVSEQEAQINYVSFINPQEGWLTYGDDILQSKDGGLNWQKIASLRGVKEVDFVSADTGWARGENTLYRSTDSGHTWQKIADFPERIRNLDFLDENYGWLLNIHGLYYTEDGGQTIQRVRSACNALNEPSGPISVTDYGQIWQSCPILGGAGMRPNVLYRSDNNGVDWQLIVDYEFEREDKSALPYHAFIYEISMLNPNQGWVFYYYRHYTDGTPPSSWYKTVDGGKSWELQEPIAEGQVQSLTMLSEQVGFVVSKQEQISQLLKTEDGGLTWKLIYQDR